MASLTILTKTRTMRGCCAQLLFEPRRGKAISVRIINCFTVSKCALWREARSMAETSGSQRMRSASLAEVNRAANGIILALLALGSHIDHVVARDAAIRLAKKGTPGMESVRRAERLWLANGT